MTSSPILLNCGPSRRGAHRLECMSRCPQYYAYRYILRLPIENSSPLDRGSLGHIGLSHHYARMGARQRGVDPDVFYSPREAMRIVAEEKGWDSAPYYSKVVNAVDAYGGYWDTMRQEEGVWEILEVEQEHEIQVGGYDYTARLDLVVKDREGGIHIVDHKFVSRIKSETTARYVLAMQFLGQQTIAQRLWKQDFRGIYLNLVEVGMAVPRFVRLQLDPAPFALQKFEQNVLDLEKRIEVLSDRDPWDYPMAATETVCVHSYGICGGYELCRWGREQAEAIATKLLFVNKQKYRDSEL